MTPLLPGYSIDWTWRGGCPKLHRLKEEPP